MGFRGYAQRDPLNEYKTEAFQLFESMLNSLRARRDAEALAGAPDHEGRAGADDGAASWRSSRPRPAPLRLPPSPSLSVRGPRRQARCADRCGCRGSTRLTRRPGAIRGATTPAPAARVRSSSTATARSSDTSKAKLHRFRLTFPQARTIQTVVPPRISLIPGPVSHVRRNRE